MKTFIRMMNDNSGAAAAEYALILAVVGTGIAFAAWGLGTKIATAMDDAGTCISSATPTATSC